MVFQVITQVQLDGIRAVVYIKPDATLTKVSEATLSEVLPQTAEHKAVQEKTVTWKID